MMMMMMMMMIVIIIITDNSEVGRGGLDSVLVGGSTRVDTIVVLVGSGQQ